MRQYHSDQTRTRTCGAFVRLGDFTKLFYEINCGIARTANHQLTSRNRRAASRAMCGFLTTRRGIYRAAAGARYKIAVCDQRSSRAGKKTRAARSGERDHSGGTRRLNFPAEGEILSCGAGACAIGKSVGLANADITTGEFLVTEFSGADADENCG